MKTMAKDENGRLPAPCEVMAWVKVILKSTGATTNKYDMHALKQVRWYVCVKRFHPADRLEDGPSH